jgi:hypothetical protein
MHARFSLFLPAARSMDGVSRGNESRTKTNAVRATGNHARALHGHGGHHLRVYARTVPVALLQHTQDYHATAHLCPPHTHERVLRAAGHQPLSVALPPSLSSLFRRDQRCKERGI